MKLRDVFHHVQVNSSINNVRMNLYSNLVFSLVPFIFVAPLIITLAAAFLALISLSINSLDWRIYSPFNYILGLGLAFILRFSLSHGMFSGEFFAVIFAFLALSKSMNLRNYGDGIIFLILILGCNATVLLMDTENSFYILIWSLAGILWALGNLLRINLKDFSSVILFASLRSAALATLYTMPLLLFLFYIFAKFSHSPIYSPSRQDTFIGLSRSLEPGRVSELQSDSSIAFRVKMDSSEIPFGDLYWKGPILSRSRGLNWQVTNKKLSEIPFMYFVASKSHCLVNQNIYIQRANLSNIQFALDTPIYSSYRGGSPYSITSDMCGGSIKYQKVHPAVLAPYLTVESGIGKDVRALALKLKRESHSEEDFKNLVFKYFKENKFEYSLNSPKLKGSSTLDGFLFKTRVGYCEHFSAAFATLARLAGIPSRVVTGFVNGKYNSYGHYWLVSYSDAHAWVELWNKNHGWVRVDPTTIIGPGYQHAPPRFVILEKMNLLVDAFFFWLRGLFNHRDTLFSIDIINPNPLQLSLLVLILLSWLFIRKGRLDYKIEIQKEFKRLSTLLNEKTIPRGRSEGLDHYRTRLLTWIQTQPKLIELASPVNKIFEEFMTWKYSSHKRTQYELRLLVRTMATVRRSIFIKTHFLNITRISK